MPSWHCAAECTRSTPHYNVKVTDCYRSQPRSAVAATLPRSLHRHGSRGGVLGIALHRHSWPVTCACIHARCSIVRSILGHSSINSSSSSSSSIVKNENRDVLALVHDIAWLACIAQPFLLRPLLSAPLHRAPFRSAPLRSTPPGRRGAVR